MGSTKQFLNYTKADGTANYDAAGNLLGYQMANYEGTAYTNTYTYTHLRRDAYMESVVSGTSNLLQPGSTTSTYDVNNNLVAVTDATKPANNRSFINDAAGRILQGTQNGNVQRQLVVNGEVLGRHGTYVNPDKPADNNGNPLFTSGSSFNFGYTKISGSYPAANPGTRTVAAGDSLQSMAESLYGDATLWYLIADANGLASDRDLRVGQTLTVPNRFTGASNNSNTFKPYNPGEVVGNTTPNLPAPPPPSGKGGCGGLGMIIMVVVAVAVTVMTSGAAATFFGGNAILGGAAAAAMGSVASQVVGNALGIVDGFDWKGVALAAISGGVGGGMSSLASGGSALSGSGIGATMARAAIGNAMTQGIAVVTGLQDKFSWTSVAASAVGAGVGAALNDSIMGTQIEGPTLPGQTLGRVGGLVGDMGGGQGAQIFGASLKGFAAGVSTAVARGGRVAVTQIATDAFGNALGESWGESLKAQSAQEQKLAALAKENAQRAETQAAAFDALTKAFSNTRSMENYGPGVLVASAGDNLPDGVVSDAGGGGNEQEELVAGTGFKLKPGGGGLKLDANSVGDAGSGSGTFGLDDMRAQFGPDAITGPDPAPEQPSARSSEPGRAKPGKSTGWMPDRPELGSASDYQKRADEQKRYAEQMRQHAASAEKSGDAKTAAEYRRMEAGYLNAAGLDQARASTIQTHTGSMSTGPSYRSSSDLGSYRDPTLARADRVAGIPEVIGNTSDFEKFVRQQLTLPSGRKEWAAYLDNQSNIFGKTALGLAAFSGPVAVAAPAFSGMSVVLDTASKILDPKPVKTLTDLMIDVAGQRINPVARDATVDLIKTIKNETPLGKQ